MPGKYTYVTWKNGRLVRRTKYYNKLNVPEYYRRDPKTHRVKPMHMRGTVRFSHDHYRPTHPGYDSLILDSGYSVNQTWIGLCRAWMGLALSNRYNDLQKLEKYANIIHRLQGELGINKTRFYNVYTSDENENEIQIDENLRDDTMTENEWLERELGRPISLSEARIALKVGPGRFGSVMSLKEELIKKVGVEAISTPLAARQDSQLHLGYYMCLISKTEST